MSLISLLKWIGTIYVLLGDGFIVLTIDFSSLTCSNRWVSFLTQFQVLLRMVFFGASVSGT